MKKSMIGVLIAAGAIAGLMAAAVFAVFTDTDSQPVSVTAGSVAIEIEADPLDLNGLMPGDKVDQCVAVKNMGDQDVIFRVYLDDVVQSPSDFADQLTQKVTLNPDECDHPDSFQVYGAPNNALADGIPLAIGKENALDNAHAAIDDGFPLFESFAAVYLVEVTFNSEAGNEYNGASLTGDLTVDATQAAGQDDPENVDWGDLDGDND